MEASAATDAQATHLASEARRGTGRQFAIVFFGSVLALYVVIGLAIYGVFVAVA